jgi:predicted membrane channel-forming protein YqfA (hemolysin III family)
MLNKYYLFRNNHINYLPDSSGLPFAIGGLVYIGGALIYVYRIPERYFPVKFDLVGASH